MWLEGKLRGQPLAVMMCSMPAMADRVRLMTDATLCDRHLSFMLFARA
jgi:hypothetical protein